MSRVELSSLESRSRGWGRQIAERHASTLCRKPGKDLRADLGSSSGVSSTATGGQFEAEVNVLLLSKYHTAVDEIATIEASHCLEISGLTITPELCGTHNAAKHSLGFCHRRLP